MNQGNSSDNKEKEATQSDIPTSESQRSKSALDRGVDALLGIRCAVGGVLMGLANLVPGISGGTMLLASGVYPKFIRAIAELSTFKFRWQSIFVLGMVAFCAAAAILLCAGLVKTLVIDHRWVMYSLFIGLTLGGVPVVWGMAKPVRRSTWIGAVMGFAPMALLAWYQTQSGDAGGPARESWILFFIAGIAGASAMILPGVSGGYLFLVLGVYVPILGGIDAFKEALKAGDVSAAIPPMLQVGIPVGLGVVAGILVVSNLIKILMQRFEKPTLGVLLGLLIGAVVGLWPFQEGVPPQIGDQYKGQTVTEVLLQELDPAKYPTQFFRPSVPQMGGAIGLIVLGLCGTGLVARMGSSRPNDD